MSSRWSSGFTLIEVLVALGIVAIALMTGLKATAVLADNAEWQVDTLLGQMCAETEFVKLRLSHQFPGLGDTHVVCEQGNRAFDVTVSVTATPNINFRRVDADVRSGGVHALRLSTVIGRY